MHNPNEEQHNNLGKHVETLWKQTEMAKSRCTIRAMHLKITNDVHLYRHKSSISLVVLCIICTYYRAPSNTIWRPQHHKPYNRIDWAPLASGLLLQITFSIAKISSSSSSMLISLTLARSIWGRWAIRESVNTLSVDDGVWWLRRMDHIVAHLHNQTSPGDPFKLLLTAWT